MSFFSIKLSPDDLEERFRLENLSRDKSQITIVILITLALVLGFIAMDFRWMQKGSALTITIICRCVTAAVSLGAIWGIQRVSDSRSFDRLVFIWMFVDLCHLAIVNAVRPTEYFPVVVWDILALFGIFFLAPIRFFYQFVTGVLMTAVSVTLWLIVRTPFVEVYETLAVFLAYIAANVFGIFVSRRLHHYRRNQFLQMLQETNLRKDLSKRTADLEKAQMELQRQAMTDSLTGINNRRYFMQLISEEVERSNRYGHSLSLMAIDIDDFKEVNDTYGHEGGDEVLKSFSYRCQCLLRNTDKLARLGGDEFIVLLIQTGQHEAKIIAERLRESIEKMNVQVNNHTVKISVSIGLITLTDNSLTVEEILRGVDSALYNAKNKGRNQVSML